MILVIQIALGIVLAVVILNFWRPIIRWSGWLALFVIVAGLLFGAINLLIGVARYLDNECDLFGKALLIVVLLIGFGASWFVLYFMGKAEESISIMLRKRIGIGLGDLFAFTIFGLIGFLGISLVRMAFLSDIHDETTTHRYIAGVIFLGIAIGLILMQNRSITKRKN